MATDEPYTTSEAYTAADIQRMAVESVRSTHRVGSGMVDTSLPDMIAHISARLDAIEARQRIYEMHDPTCPKAPSAPYRPGQSWDALTCLCWLSR